MEFAEGKLAEEKVFDGFVFPKTLFPPLAGAGDQSKSQLLAEIIKEKREWLNQTLDRHSAVLFRGFGVSSAEEFQRVVEAFGWEEMPYVGAISRTKVADRVYTANEAPLHHPIGFHHEMSTVKNFPSKVFFYCAQPSPKGGETSILHGSVIIEKMEEQLPDFVAELQRLGYVFQTKTAKEDEASTIISKTWKKWFNTEDKVEAEQRAREKLGCSSVRFNEDGSAEIVYGPLNPIKHFGEKRVWFHHLVGRNEGDTDNYFGDGGVPLPRTALDVYRKITKENCVDIKWQKGDVLLVDNLCVQHARRAGAAPRKILVSVCK